MFWTKAREQVAAALSAAGFSRVAVAEEIGTTKNAVCGKLHRMKEPKKPIMDRWDDRHISNLLQERPIVARLLFSTPKESARVDLFLRDHSNTLHNELTILGWRWAGCYLNLSKGDSGFFYLHDDVVSTTYYATTKALRRKMIKASPAEVRQLRLKQADVPAPPPAAAPPIPKPWLKPHPYCALRVIEVNVHAGSARFVGDVYSERAAFDSCKEVWNSTAVAGDFRVILYPDGRVKGGIGRDKCSNEDWRRAENIARDLPLPVLIP